MKQKQIIMCSAQFEDTEYLTTIGVPLSSISYVRSTEHANQWDVVLKKDCNIDGITHITVSASHYNNRVQDDTIEELGMLIGGEE